MVASIYRAGAGIGPVMALMTARGLLSMQLLLVWQIPFFGVELPLARYIVCLIVPPTVALVGRAVFHVIGEPTHVTNTNRRSVSDAAQEGRRESGTTHREK